MFEKFNQVHFFLSFSWHLIIHIHIDKNGFKGK